MDLVDGNVIEFLNYLDEGHRTTLEVTEHHQKFVRLACVRSSCVLSNASSFHSSEISSHRLGNERTVRLPKLSISFQ